MALPIQNPCVPPKAIAGLTGDVPDALLEQVDSRTSRAFLMARGGPARGMRAMHAAMRADLGIIPTSTGRTRRFSDQYNLFLTRHDPVSYAVYSALPATGGKRRYWPEATSVFRLQSQYWRLKAGMAAAAVPSFTAPHVRACADDMAELDANGTVVGVSARTVAWLSAHARTYGFAASLESEPWHWQWIMGDQIPPAVVAYERGGLQIPEVVAPVLPGPEDPPAAVPAPKEDKLATARITVEGRNAEFYGTGTLMPDNSVHCVLVTWSGPGDESFHQDHSGAGDIVRMNVDPEVFQRDLVLIGDPAEINDSSYKWTPADFYRVVS